jgi:hypothetical protein
MKLQETLAAMRDGDETCGEFEHEGDNIQYNIARYGPEWELWISCSRYPWPGSPPDVYHEGAEYFEFPADVVGALGGLGYAEPVEVDDMTPDMLMGLC